MTATAYVYVLFRTDGSPCYVGKGRGRRWLDHTSVSRTHNRYIARIIRTAQKNGRELPVVKIREGLTDEEAYAIEVALIKAIGRIKDGGCLVNQSDGGDGVRGLGPESRAKLRAFRLGKKLSPETCAKIGAAHRGRKRPPETGAAISAALKGRPKSLEVRAGWSKQRKGVPRGPCSDSRRASISRANKAYWERWRTEESVRSSRTDRANGYSDERKAAISAGHRRYWERVRDIEIGDDLQ